MSRRFEPNWDEVLLALFVVSLVLTMWSISGKEQMQEASRGEHKSVRP